MPVELICTVCGNAFKTKPHKALTAKFCSHECRLHGLHDKLRRDRQKPERQCAHCGEVYRRAPSAAGLYCSQVCTKAAQSNTLHGVFDRVDQSSGPESCWPWIGSVSIWGYGKFHYQGEWTNAHRAAYEAIHGTVSPDLVVAHSCDNRLCCNPAHLSAVPQQENIHDMMRKGRAKWQKPTHPQVDEPRED